MSINYHTGTADSLDYSRLGISRICWLIWWCHIG